jgi:hypothetical protein
MLTECHPVSNPGRGLERVDDPPDKIREDVLDPECEGGSRKLQREGNDLRKPGLGASNYANDLPEEMDGDEDLRKRDDHVIRVRQ